MIEYYLVSDNGGSEYLRKYSYAGNLMTFTRNRDRGSIGFFVSTSANTPWGQHLLATETYRLLWRGETSEKAEQPLRYPIYQVGQRQDDDKENRLADGVQNEKYRRCNNGQYGTLQQAE